jgi:hypothetical protein
MNNEYTVHGWRAKERILNGKFKRRFGFEHRLSAQVQQVIKKRR